MSGRITLSERFAASSRKTPSVTAQRAEERRKASREEQRMRQRRAAAESSAQSRGSKAGGPVNLATVVFDDSVRIKSKDPHHKPVVVLAPQIKRKQQQQKARRTLSSAPGNKGQNKIHVVFGGPIVEPPSHQRRRQNIQRRAGGRQGSGRPRQGKVTKEQLDSSLDAYMRS